MAKESHGGQATNYRGIVRSNQNKSYHDTTIKIDDFLNTIGFVHVVQLTGNCKSLEEGSDIL